MTKKYELKVTADTNDADYITEISIVDQEELDKLIPMFKKISKFKECKTKGRTHRHNFPYGDCLRDDLGEKSVQELYGWSDDELDYLTDFLPMDEYGIHTIESVEFYDVPKKTVII